MKKYEVVFSDPIIKEEIMADFIRSEINGRISFWRKNGNDKPDEMVAYYFEPINVKLVEDISNNVNISISLINVEEFKNILESNKDQIISFINDAIKRH